MYRDKLYTFDEQKAKSKPFVVGVPQHNQTEQTPEKAKILIYGSDQTITVPINNKTTKMDLILKSKLE